MAGSGQFRMGDLEVPGWVGKYGIKAVLGVIGVVLALCCCCIFGGLAVFGPMLGITPPMQATPGAGAFGAVTPYTPSPVFVTVTPPVPSGTPTMVPAPPTATPTSTLVPTYPPGVTPMWTPPSGVTPAPGVVAYFNTQLLGGSDEIAMMLPYERDGLETPADRRRDLGWLTSELRKAEPGLLVADETLVAGGDQPYGRYIAIYKAGADTGDRIKIACEVWRVERPDLGYWALDTSWVWHRVKPSQ